jgi:hypothetical protein
MQNVPMIIALVAILLWAMAHSPFILKFSPLVLDFNSYVAVICAVYFLQCLATIVEFRYLELKTRTSRICAYVILFIATSFLPIWKVIETIGLPFYGPILTIWAFFSWGSFLVVFFVTFRHDQDLPFGTRMTPFAFSVLGALTSWLWSISI